MPAELLALLAAACFALGSITGKIATEHGPVLGGFVHTLLATTTTLGGYALVVVDVWSMPFSLMVIFAASGLVGAGLGRLVMLRALREVGATVAVPLQSSSNPLIATIVGALVFQELVHADRWIALGFILAGIWLCAKGGSANRLAVTRRGPGSGRALLALSTPLAAGALFASGDVLRKAALDLGGSAVLGALVAGVTAQLAWLLLLPIVRRLQKTSMTGGGHSRLSMRSVRWFWVSGVAYGCAQLSSITALSTGDLSLVSSILSCQPILIVILGAGLLRKVEILRPAVIAGATVAGGAVMYLAISA